MRTRHSFPVLLVALVLGLTAHGEAHARSGWHFRFPCLVSNASAQEVMKFERVSPESAAAMERRGHTHVSAPAVTPENPDVPEPPEAPEPPDLPEVSRGGDVVRIGSDIHVERGQVIDGDVFALRGDITVDGHVKGNVATTGGDVHLGPTAKVDGDVMCIGGELIEDPGAFVGGQRVTALRGGSVKQRIAQRIRDRIRSGGRYEGRDHGGAIGFAFSWLLFSVLIAWLYAKIAPTRTGVAYQALREKPGTSLGAGFLMLLLLGPSVIALALAMAILCITIIGIPLAILLLPAYGLLIAMVIQWGFVLGASVVGQQMTGRWPSLMSGAVTVRRHAVLGAMGISGMLLTSAVLRFIPFFGWVSTLLWVLGWIVFGFITLAGAGALLRSKFGLGPDGRWWPPFGPGPQPMTAGAPPSVPPPPSAAAPPPAPMPEPFPENPPAAP